MADPMEVLMASLLRAKDESHLVEWKEFFPRSKTDSGGKNAYAREIAALANTALQLGGDTAYLFAGISRDGEVVGVDQSPGDLKILTDFLRSRVRPLPTVELGYLDKEELSEELPQLRIGGGVYWIRVWRPDKVPFMYYKNGKGNGAVLVRMGESVEDAGPYGTFELADKIRTGAIQLLSDEDKEILVRIADDSRLVAELLKKGESKRASRVAYHLLISYKRIPLFLRLQHSPVLLFPMIWERIDPFSLLFTASGHRMWLSFSVYPKQKREWAQLDDVEYHIDNWSRLATVARNLLEEGVPPRLREVKESYNFHEAVKGIGRVAKKILDAYSEQEKGLVPFHWIHRVYPLRSVSMLPPRDWEPASPAWKVDGIVWVRRMKSRLSEKGVAVQLPLLQWARRDRILIWWALFLDPAVFTNLVMWSESFNGGSAEYPWEREDWDLYAEGKIDLHELQSRPRPRGRVDLKPAALLAIAGSITSVVIAVYEENPVHLWIIALLWPLFGVLLYLSRSKEVRTIGVEEEMD